MAKNGKKWAVAAVVAGAAGYVAGLLTAPKSGKETRKDIKDAAGKAKAEAERVLKELHSDLDALIIKVKQQAKNLSEKGQQELVKAIEKASLAKEKARGVLSALHEGDVADDKDLQNAIQDVKSSIDNLKKYLKKNGEVS